MHRPAQLLALCCAIALLGGCHRHGDAATAPVAATPAKAPSSKPEAAKAPTPSPAPSPASTATAPAHASSASRPASANDNDLRVASLTLGTAIDSGYAVTVAATRFSADTHTIYASVATTGHTASAKLGVHWRYLEGKGTLVNELSQTIATDGPATTTFEVQNPNRWPAGKYVVEISLDGKPAAQQAFEVTEGK